MKPILLSTPMVRAILDGRKTMTRRVLKGTALKWLINDAFTPSFIADPGNYLCPYGYAGDILWVRETWAKNRDVHEILSGFMYKADGGKGFLKFKWRPSIFMPREAARIFLRVTDVRVERLRDISVQDAKDEGIKVHANGCKDGMAFGCYNGDDCVYNRCKRPIEYFHELWDSINAKRGYGWDTNPWVWVISFERCEKPEAADA